MIVETRALTKRYSATTALSNCTMQVRRGEVFGMLGPNGAGKTTLIRMLMGFLQPTSGSASIDGLDCTTQSLTIRQRVSYLPGEAKLFRRMRGRDVLNFFVEVRGDGNLQTGLAVASRLDLDLRRRVASMSTGMRQKLAISVVFANEAPLLILDEPTANLDPTVRGEVLAMVHEAREAGKTVILSSHVLPEMEDVCDRVAFLRRGEFVHLQEMAKLRCVHSLTANISGELPDLPRALVADIHLTRDANRLSLRADAVSPEFFTWLASARLSDVRMEPIGLRAVYDRFYHNAASGSAKAAS